MENGPAGRVDRRRGRRARGIDREARSRPPEVMADPARRERAQIADCRIRRGRVASHVILVIVQSHPEVAPDGLLGEAEITRLLQGLVGHLQHEPVLRVSGRAFAGRFPEELLVEAGGVVVREEISVEFPTRVRVSPGCGNPAESRGGHWSVLRCAAAKERPEFV